MLETYIGLLRGINVGGKNKLPMADLSRMCRDIGCQDVQTYIQSGNVVFRAAAGQDRELAERLSARILEEKGLRVPLVIRTRAEFETVVPANPFLAAGADPDTILVMFLAASPTPEALQSLDPERSPGDRFQVVGREIYCQFGNGLRDTKLTNDYFDRRLKTTSTGRNWRTVLKLLELASTP
ncbi:MAG TPA: DUF1697 domain-containing protein [Stenomitos sp.]